MLITTPAMIWSTLNLIASQASRAPSKAPTTMAPATPAQVPKALDKITATKAPVRSWPSIPMLMTPTRSQVRPVRAPRVITIEEMTVERSMPTRLNELSAAAHASKASTNRSSPIPRARLVRSRFRRRRLLAPRAKMRTPATAEKMRELKVHATPWMASVGRLRLKVDEASGGTPNAKTPITTAARAMRTIPMIVALRSSTLVRSTTSGVVVSTLSITVTIPTPLSVGSASHRRL
jgi:hypothetical protein